MPEPIRVLLIDDDPVSADLVMGTLARDPLTEFSVGWAQSLADGLKRIRDTRPDAAIVDLSLPDSTGLHSFLEVHKQAPEIPKVVLSSTDDERVALEAVKLGAQDYLAKGPEAMRTLAGSLVHAIEHKRAANERDRLAAFPEQNPYPILELSEDRRIVYMNTAAKEAFPDLEEKGLGHPLLQGIDDVMKTLCEDHGRPLIQTVSLKDRSYELRIHCVIEHRVVHVYVLDISERTHVERLKEEFLHNVSHELRTPLTAICQAVQLVSDGLAGEVSEQQKKFLGIADRNAEHLRLMIEDLLETTRAETGKLIVEPRVASISEIVEEVAGTERVSKSGKGIAIECEAPASLPPVYADPVRIKQVFINLIDNAVKFMQGEGRVTLMARAEGPRAVTVSVADTGPGIEREAAAHIFDRLYQVRSESREGRKGLGLGLYICKQIIDRHGGRIWAESEEGKGSVFSFTLPVFSLGALLEPVLFHEGRRARHAAFLTVRVFPRLNDLTDKTARNVLCEARRVVGQNLHHGDLLLPEMSPHGQEGLLFVAAPVHPKAVANMTRRLEHVLSLPHIIRSNRLQPSITHRMVELSAGEEVPAEEFAWAAAADIGAMVRKALNERLAEGGGEG